MQLNYALLFVIVRYIYSLMCPVSFLHDSHLTVLNSPAAEVKKKKSSKNPKPEFFSIQVMNITC